MPRAGGGGWGRGIQRVFVVFQLAAAVPLAPRGAPTAITLAGQASPLPLGLVPAAATAVDTGYFSALGIPVVRGRAFGAVDLPNGPPVAIVNQWAADRWWPGGNPIGQLIRVDTAPGASLPSRSSG